MNKSVEHVKQELTLKSNRFSLIKTDSKTSKRLIKIKKFWEINENLTNF